MGINHYFIEKLGTKLRNPRWSWGAIDPVTNRVFLMLWEDHIVKGKKDRRVRLLANTQRRHSNGRNERKEHIKLMENGTQGFGIVCRAVDTDPVGPRTIANFNRRSILKLGKIVEKNDGLYARIKSAVPVK